MTNVRPEDLSAVYLQGWSASTLRVYTAAFKDIVRYGGVIGRHWYRWNSGDVTSYLINGSALTPNSIKKFGAVMSLLFGCCDRPSPAVGPLVNKVKVGVLKNVTTSRQAPRPLWTPENMLIFVTTLSAPNKTFMDWRIMALQLLCYLSMRRFSDFQNIKVGDITVLANGDLRIFQKVGKTFQSGQGNFIHILNKPFGGFTVKSIIQTYINRLGLARDDFLFPRFAGSSTGVLTVCKVSMGYGNARQELHRVLSELSLPQVSLHSARASAATQAAEAGLEINTLMGGGGWSGTSVFNYVRSERPLQRVQTALYNGLNDCTSTVVSGSHTHTH